MDSRQVLTWAVAVGVGGCGGAVDGRDDVGAAPPAQGTLTLQSQAPLAPNVSLGPDNTWTWYDQVPGAKCADGSPTGFAINPLRTGNGKVLVFLEGGGACADKNACAGPFKTVTHMNYGASTFASEMTSTASRSELVNLAPFGSYTWNKVQGARGLWDRTSEANPFRNYNFVFIPYCTADMYAGNRQDTSSAFPSVRTPSQSWFVGFNNFQIFAQQVRGAFPAPPSIALVGGSAGGFGTVYNYPQLKALYPAVPMSVISDSGTPFWTGDEGFSPRQGYWMLNFELPGVPSYEEDWFADAWGLDATHPAGVMAVTRTGAQRSIYPIQSSLIANASGSSDQFGFIEGSNDWVTPLVLAPERQRPLAPEHQRRAGGLQREREARQRAHPLDLEHPGPEPQPEDLEPAPRVRPGRRQHVDAERGASVADESVQSVRGAASLTPDPLPDEILGARRLARGR